MRKPNEDSIPTRASLLSRLKDWDDNESWKTFVDTYWRLIYRSAIKAGLNDAEAKDATQETIFIVCKKMRDFKYDPALGKFKAWLLNTARWKIADQFRKRAGKVKSLPATRDDSDRTPIAERIPDPNSLNLDSILEEEYQQNLVEAALDRIKHRVNDKDFQIFHCYVVKEWTVQEVMKTLGVSRYQVYNAKSRISKLLRKEIEQLETKML